MLSFCSPELMYEVAEAVGEEARAHQNYAQGQGIYRAFNGTVCLGPNINIMRHPLWGRNAVSMSSGIDHLP